MKRVSKVLTALVLGTVLAGLAAGCGGGEKKADIPLRLVPTLK